MKKCTALLLCFLPLLFLPAEEMELQSIVRFDGTSTLHDFTGFATSKVERVEWIPNGQGGSLTAESIEFDVEKLTTDHKKRDKKMMKMFKPSDFPLITGQLKNWDVGGGSEAPSVLLLKIQDSELEIPVILSEVIVDETGIHFTSNFSLSLKAFGLKRPSALGFIRVGDEVNVEIETTLRKPESTP